MSLPLLRRWKIFGNQAAMLKAVWKGLYIIPSAAACPARTAQAADDRPEFLAYI